MRPRLFSSLEIEKKLSIIKKQINIEDLTTRFCMCEIEMDRYLANLSKLSTVLNSDEIWPDQCNYVVRILKQVQESTGRLCNLIKTIPSSITGEATNRYALLVKSSYVESAISELMIELTNYMDGNQSVSSLKAGDVEKIRVNLEKIFTNYRSLKDDITNVVINSTLPNSYKC